MGDALFEDVKPITMLALTAATLALAREARAQAPAPKPKPEETAIVVQTSGDPPGDLPVEADLSGVRPEDKTVTIRPWLLDTPDA